MFDHLFQLLQPHLLFLFPSTRLALAAASLPPNTAITPLHGTDALDQPVWQFLVTSLREKVLENVASANKVWVTDEDERIAKIGNVNLFLHALGLDSSQISI
jgi:DNA topoisomerase 2-associated protein PAT1